MMKNTIALIATTIMIGSAYTGACAATGQITVTDTGSYLKNSSAANPTTLTAAQLGGFEANGADKLVVSVGSEASGAGGNNVVLGVTYGGASLTKINGATDGNLKRVSLWMLDDVTMAGDLVITFTSGTPNGVGVSAIAMVGTKTGLADSNAAGYASSVTIETTVDGELVFAAATNNSTTSPPRPNSPMIQIFSGAIGSAGGGAGYFTAISSGTYSMSFAGSSIRATAAVAFQPTPPPDGTMVMSK